jgi:hypothetical protein
MNNCRVSNGESVLSLSLYFITLKQVAIFSKVFKCLK